MTDDVKSILSRVCFRRKTAHTGSYYTYNRLNVSMVIGDAEIIGRNSINTNNAKARLIQASNRKSNE